MRRTRVIPLLLMNNGSLIKTVAFRNPKYIGDPVNTVRLFSEKAADELIVLDVSAGPAGRSPDLRALNALAGEAFMPVAYGGGIRSISDAKSVFDVGIEKVVLGAAAVEQPDLIEAIVGQFGAQSVVVCVDAVRRSLGRARVATHRATRRHELTPVQLAEDSVRRGAGEILIQSVERDGTMNGYDIETTRSVADAVRVPVIACGGAGNLEHLRQAVDAGGASAVAAGSLFIFHGRLRAVLVNYPAEDTLEALLP